MAMHNPPAGAPCWFELSSSDPSRSRAFHQQLFGWSGVDHDMGEYGTYTFLRNGNGTVGALCGLPPGAEGMPSSWGVYFRVDDLDERMARALSRGGKALCEPFDVPGHGRGVALADPGGAVFSLWQPASDDPGDFVMFEDHAIGWVELATRDTSMAGAFYGDLLGWTLQRTTIPAAGGMEYTEYAINDTRYGGLLAMTAEWGDIPSHWSLYVPVPDVDACLARASELGGSVCVPAFDAPGVGRIGRLDDPTGAGVYVITLNANR
ncbi:MAG TPA: VOC family protein [Arenimonas sp.]|nr:VOC family protein [Arenimonas sp.]